MTLLSIETSTDSCSLAIAKDGHSLQTYVCDKHANHAQLLPMYVEECMSWLCTQNVHLDAVALSMGPGSYTGLRIGASVAKGICYGLNIPLIPIDTLRSIAWKAAKQIRPDTNMLLCPMIDARRMEVYTAFYVGKEAEQETEVKAVVINDESFMAELNHHIVYFVGNGAQKCKTILQSKSARFIDDIIPTADIVAELATFIIQQGTAKMLNEKQLAYFEPFYLKEFIPAPSHIKGLEKK